MKAMKLIITSVICLLLSVTIKAQDLLDSANISVFELNNFSPDISSGYRYNLWIPGGRKDVMNIHTEGLQSADIGLSIKYNNKTLVFYNIERPLQGTEEQSQIIAKNKTQNPGMEKLSFGFSLDSFKDFVSVKNRFISALFSTRLINSKEVFFGNATALEQFDYVDDTSTLERIDDDTVIFSNLQRFSEGESFGFQTEFKDFSITIAWPWGSNSPPFDIRFGGYSIEWKRPSSHTRTWFSVADGTLVIYDTTFKSKGLELGIESLDYKSPGLNGYFNLRWGIDNEISNVVDRSYEEATGRDTLLYGSFILNLWHNWYAKGKDDGVYFTVGASGSRRAFHFKYNPVKGGIIREDLFKGYARVGYSF